ncbi:hypothetical protein OBBRIDRAFT_420673 [Obba rivulosa]|uniref:Uncharacterized protein n=1 Tax=Obba rivulosa TaxID=1052685 RepID=A0A8E2DE01_9APHY|nr:hypothetical protein OBBRIDRAFT_420673 [Obba rivulosa]
MGSVVRVSVDMIGNIPETFSDLAQIMWTFPGMQDLCLDLLWKLHPIEPGSTEFSLVSDGLAALYLHRLELYSFSSVFSACARSRLLNRLQKSSAHLHNTAEVPGILLLLQSCCGTLRKLEIDTVCSEAIAVTRE